MEIAKRKAVPTFTTIVSLKSSDVERKEKAREAKEKEKEKVREKVKARRVRRAKEKEKAEHAILVGRKDMNRRIAGIIPITRRRTTTSKAMVTTNSQSSKMVRELYRLEVVKLSLNPHEERPHPDCKIDQCAPKSEH